MPSRSPGRHSAPAPCCCNASPPFAFVCGYVPPAAAGGPSPPEQFQAFVADLYRIGHGQGLVIMLAEVTAVPQTFRQAFFSTLRSMFNQRNDPGAEASIPPTAFIFAGSFDPEGFIRVNSPFNVAITFDTKDFDFSVEETTAIANKAGVSTSAQDVHTWSNGHPYLTNRLIELLSSGKQKADLLACNDPRDEQRGTGTGARL